MVESTHAYLGALGVISSFSLSPAWKNEALLEVVGISVTSTNSSDSVSPPLAGSVPRSQMERSHNIEHAIKGNPYRLVR